jgi:hypothetical protein
VRALEEHFPSLPISSPLSLYLGTEAPIDTIPANLPEGEGLGRFWGTIGAVEQAEGEDQKLTDRETIQLKRFLRRYLHSTQKRRKKRQDGSVVLVRPKRRYEKALRNERFAGFVAIRKASVQRFLDSG